MSLNLEKRNETRRVIEDEVGPKVEVLVQEVTDRIRDLALAREADRVARSRGATPDREADPNLAANHRRVTKEEDLAMTKSPVLDRALDPREAEATIVSGKTDADPPPPKIAKGPGPNHPRRRPPRENPNPDPDPRPNRDRDPNRRRQIERKRKKDADRASELL